MYNIILNTDSYKTSHFLQYPQGIQYLSSYIESRGGQYTQSVFFGLQMFIRKYLLTPVTGADIDEAREVLSLHGLPFNEEGWRYIVEHHNGFLPVEIQALPEGTVVPVRTPLVQVINTDPACAWLTSYLETALLRAVWYPTTVATLSWHCREIIAGYLQETADSSDSLPFRLHDFGARGVSSAESAETGGLAHLISFSGTDTLAAVMAGRRYYHEPMAGFSIPAAEHSTVTSWGRAHEREAYENMLNQFSAPGKVFAVVSDSYDLWNAIDHIWGEELHQKIKRSGGTLVIRPDSGDPVNIVTETIERLMSCFGYEVNSRGYRVLPPYIRVIQGDGISLYTIEAILMAMKNRRQSADNITFGMGGELLQKPDRDTLRFAMKASAVRTEGVWTDVYKDPATDPKKSSRKGRQAVVLHEGIPRAVRESELKNRENLLRPVFRNGSLLVDEPFSLIRERAAVNMK